MNIPVLKKDFLGGSKDRIGFLKDVIKCKVTEERHGAFFLEMTYKNIGDIVSEIKVGRIIEAFASVELGKQHFRIYDIKKDIKGNINISAEHITADLKKMYVYEGKLKDKTVLEILNEVLFTRNVCEPCHFSASSEFSNTISVNYTFQSVLECFYGRESSLVDVLGGNVEVIRDNNSLKVNKSRGKERKNTLQYRKNISDFICIENKDHAYTHLFPYVIHENGNMQGLDRKYTTIVKYSLKIRDHEGESYNVLEKDFTSDPFWDKNTITKDNLLKLSNNYIKKLKKTPRFKYEIKISDVMLKKEEDLKNVGLCDTFKLNNDLYNISMKVKVVELTVDSLTGLPLNIILEEIPN